jgi:hypothetical protein
VQAPSHARAWGAAGAPVLARAEQLREIRLVLVDVQVEHAAAGLLEVQAGEHRVVEKAEPARARGLARRDACRQSD